MKQYCYGSVKMYGKFLSFYVRDLFMTAGYTSLVLWILQMCIYCPYLWPMLIPPYILCKFHSTIYSLKSANEYVVVQRMQNVTDTLCLKFNSKNKTKTMYTHSLSPWLLWSMASNMEGIIFYLMGQYS